MKKLQLILPIFIFLIFSSMQSTAQQPVHTSDPSLQPRNVVELFLREVRSGRQPQLASRFMAPEVLAHQLNSENPVTVKRTPANYAAHVEEFISIFGKFEFEVTELLADGDKVYARWIQKGKHLSDIDAYKATGRPLIEYTSAVYRVTGGKITEYWIQSDRLGMEMQLSRNASGTGK